MRARPISVTIFGILNIGFGFLGMADVLLSRLFENFGSSAANPQVNSLVAFFGALQNDPAYILWNKITEPLDFVVGAALLVSGIGLLLLKNWARLTSVGFAVYKGAFVVLNALVLVAALRHILAKSFANSGPGLIILLVAVGVFAAILTLAYPALLLFFLTRPKMVQAFQPEPPGIHGGRI
jgi:hypothetical protein